MSESLRPIEKVRLACRVWSVYARVRLALAHEPLPALVARLGRPPRRAPAQPPDRLARAVDRSLRLGRRQPRCLVSALVLFRLLREQGDPAELVIGLPEGARTKDAHAWVELGARDVGPPPGRGANRELARYG
ncbi:MAG TPA: lasso peptide biosynthesis B2 protein [Gaiellaceae bacterium]|nr:lasso peptide biosynthesis B2 protein [Gaiellaceae bacterium]